MSGFWTSFNQIFYTLPVYIEDFVDTQILLAFLTSTMSTIGLGGYIEGFKDSMVKCRSGKSRIYN
jgi:POT family proton-dependent oligopeptide transporter